MHDGIHVLGVETSCDDTCAAVVRDVTHVVSSIVSSQHAFHRPYGGVVPEVAARQHTRLICFVIEEAIQTARISWEMLSGIAVTAEPGLIGSLLVGVGAAKGIALGRDLPLVPVNHLYAHVQSVFVARPDVSCPFLCLVVSGGHTLLLFVTGPGEARVMGSTLDDAAGEAIDKGAHLLGLEYPGGPHLDRLARTGDRDAIPFPRPLEKKPGFDFSFSGLKTALAVYLRKHGQPATDAERKNLSASYLEAIVDVLVKKTMAAARAAAVPTVGLAGGVAANSRLRNALLEAGFDEGFDVILPPPQLCTDNAAMVASLGCSLLLDDHRGTLSVDARATARFPRWKR